MVMTSPIPFVTACRVRGDSRLLSIPSRRATASFPRLRPAACDEHFPHVSLLTIGAVTLPFCFFSLGQLVSWLIQADPAQFVWQCAAVILLRRYRPDIAKPFRMWLYPPPALVSMATWIYIPPPRSPARFDGVPRRRGRRFCAL
jgi:hypothetical protein